jgi:hypothetical protein
MISLSGIIRELREENARLRKALNITPEMFEAGNQVQHPDDCTDVRTIYRAMIAVAIATGTRSAETNEDLAQSEGCQSGGDSRIAQRGDA